MASILKLRDDDEELEREHDLRFLRALTTEQRFRMVLETSRRILQTLLERGHRRPFEILKRR